MATRNGPEFTNAQSHAANARTRLLLLSQLGTCPRLGNATVDVQVAVATSVLSAVSALNRALSLHSNPPVTDVDELFKYGKLTAVHAKVVVCSRGLRLLASNSLVSCSVDTHRHWLRGAL